jgi:hypothetical protein
MGEERDGSKNGRKSDRNQKMEKDMLSVKKRKKSPPGWAKRKINGRVGRSGCR